MRHTIQERHDPFYFSRSDLSGEEKITILGSKLKQGLEDIKAGRAYPLNEVIDEIVAKFSSMIKIAV